MTIHNDKDISQRVWEGDHSVVGDLVNDPNIKFVSKISVLYSFRKQEKDNLMKYVGEVEEAAKKLTKQVLLNKHDADDADVLSTVLVWMSDQLVSRSEILRRLGLRGIAYELAHRGLEFKFVIRDHTPVLLYTTLARDNRRYLIRAINLAPMIIDVNQRARAWKRIGAVYLMNRNPKGFWYLLQALLVKGVTRDVRRKVIQP